MINTIPKSVGEIKLGPASVRTSGGGGVRLDEKFDIRVLRIWDADWDDVRRVREIVDSEGGVERVGEGR